MRSFLACLVSRSNPSADSNRKEAEEEEEGARMKNVHFTGCQVKCQLQERKNGIVFSAIVDSIQYSWIQAWKHTLAGTVCEPDCLK